MANFQPTHDAVARVVLFGPERGGRRTAIPPIRFRCPVFFGEGRQVGHDCMFNFEEIGAGLEPGGESREVPIKFLSRETVAELLHSGMRFILWEGRDIGEGEILKIV